MKRNWGRAAEVLARENPAERSGQPVTRSDEAQRAKFSPRRQYPFFGRCPPRSAARCGPEVRRPAPALTKAFPNAGPARNLPPHPHFHALMNRLVTLLFSVLFLAACSKAPEPGAGGGAKKVTIALLPKSKGNQYFVNVEKGAREAAQELGVELVFDRPTNTDLAN